jgi:hypothetical protein
MMVSQRSLLVATMFVAGVVTMPEATVVVGETASRSEKNAIVTQRYEHVYCDERRLEIETFE